MQYGAMNFPVKPVVDELKKIAGLGFDYLELTLDPPCSHYLDILEIETELVNLLERFSMPLVCHLPTFVYTADLAPGIRRASIDEMRHSLRTAARINAKKAVLHPSFISGLGPLVLDSAKGLANESFKTIVAEADTLGLCICFENMYPNYHTYFDPDHFSSLFSRYPDLKLTLDTGHANIDDPTHCRLFEFIQRFPDRIGHIHISDNNGKKDEHVKVGKGNINFVKFTQMIKETGYDDTITLEIFSQNTADLVESRDRISALLSS